MRKALGVVLIGVGVFGLVMTILLPTVVVSQSKKTPLNLDITQISSGPAKLLDVTTGKTSDVNLRATRVVKTDSHLSDDKNTTVFETLCIIIVRGGDKSQCAKDSRLLSVTTDQVAADRVSAESVHVPGWNENVNGDTSVRHTGLTYKWPIDTKKKNYQYYVTDLEKAFTAVYVGTAKREGLTVYKFVVKTGPQPYQIQATAPGTYNDVTTAYVEPITGAVVDGSDHQIQTLKDGTLALDTTLSFDKSAIDYQANYSKDAINKLHLAQVWGPIATGIIGVVALIGAYFLLRRRSDGGRSRHADTDTDPDDAQNTSNDSGAHGDGGPVLADSNSQT